MISLPSAYPLLVFLLPWGQPQGNGPVVPAGKGKMAVLEPVSLLPPYLRKEAQCGIVEGLDRSVHN